MALSPDSLKCGSLGAEATIVLYMCTTTRSRYVKLDITGQNWKQVDSCMYLQSVAEKTLLIRVEADGKLQNLKLIS